MKLVVGLGNSGKEYERSRHNAGFIVLDTHITKMNLSWSPSKRLHSLVAKDGDVMYAKPQTFMNESGDAVLNIVNYYGINPEDMTVVHDDVDMEFGKIKKKFGMSSGGHHGVESIIKCLGTDVFWRIKIGVGRPNERKFDVSDYVLGDFSEEELQHIVESAGRIIFS